MSARRYLSDIGSLFNNSSQGIFQDFLDEYLDRPDASPFGGIGGGGFGGSGFFNNYIEQIIQQLSENDIK
jgi:hypothetical protein